MSDETPPIATEENPYRDVKYVAKVLSFTTQTIRMWLREERLKGYLIGGEWRVLQSDLVEFCKKEYGNDGK